MNKWAHIENIVILIAVTVLLILGHPWGLLLLFVVNTGSSKR
jgi:hypothetical protein